METNVARLPLLLHFLNSFSNSIAHFSPKIYMYIPPFEAYKKVFQDSLQLLYIIVPKGLKIEVDFQMEWWGEDETN